MLCFRVLLEACLFECLFSPLAFSSSEETRGLWCSSGRKKARLPKWRDDESALLRPPLNGGVAVGNTLSTQTLNQRGATQVKTMSGRGSFAESLVNLQKHLRIVRSSQLFGKTTNNNLSDLKSGKRTR